MKTLKIFLFACIGIAFFSGCKNMDDTYLEFIGDGPTIYLARADSIYVASGRNRVQFTWNALNDPRVKTAKILWANNSKTVTKDIVQGERTQFIIDGLDESSYIFDIFFLDDAGHSSVKMTTNANAYGEVYENYLLNCSVKGTSKVESNLTITFTLYNDDTAVGTQVFWNDGSEDKEFLIEYPAKKDDFVPSATIENYTGFPVNYRMVYKPTPDCIDTFYSETSVFQE